MRSANSFSEDYLTFVSATPATHCMAATIGFPFAGVEDATIQKVIEQTVFGQIRRQLGHMSHQLARQKEYRILDRHLISNHIHMRVGLPRKHSVASLR